ncbi:hypothetical protein SDC9_188534 [bioreactor metagenome]|uniref:Uncharacterized protein n=1 Tax=bioreactor metagenome TaxID=1076179 RepID=A0A645HXU8_9ZZZZ
MRREYAPGPRFSSGVSRRQTAPAVEQKAAVIFELCIAKHPLEINGVVDSADDADYRHSLQKFHIQQLAGKPRRRRGYLPVAAVAFRQRSPVNELVYLRVSALKVVADGERSLDELEDKIFLRLAFVGISVAQGDFIYAPQEHAREQRYVGQPYAEKSEPHAFSPRDEQACASSGVGAL